MSLLSGKNLISLCFSGYSLHSFSNHGSWSRFSLHVRYAIRFPFYVNLLQVSLFRFICGLLAFAFSALTLLVGCQEGHPARKNLTDEVLAWLSSGAKCLRMVQLMPQLPHHVCFSKIQNGLSFWYRLTRVAPDKGLQTCSSSSFPYNSASYPQYRHRVLAKGSDALWLGSKGRTVHSICG